MGGLFVLVAGVGALLGVFGLLGKAGLARCFVLMRGLSAAAVFVVELLLVDE